MWIDLPSARLLPESKHARRPVVRLRLASYGRPLSGMCCEQQCNKCSAELGIERVPHWKQGFARKKISLTLSF